MISSCLIPEDLRVAGRATVAWRKCVIIGSVEKRRGEPKLPRNDVDQLEIFKGMTGGC